VWFWRFSFSLFRKSFLRIVVEFQADYFISKNLINALQSQAIYQLKINFMKPLKLLLAAAAAVISNGAIAFAGEKRNQEVMRDSFGKMKDGKFGDINQLAAQCVENEPEFVMKSKKKVGGKYETADSFAYPGVIEFSESSFKRTKAVLPSNMRHEVMHSALRAVNEESLFANPYSNEQEKAEYHKALDEFNTNLNSFKKSLEDKLNGKKLSPEKMEMAKKLHRGEPIVNSMTKASMPDAVYSHFLKAAKKGALLKFFPGQPQVAQSFPAKVLEDVKITDFGLELLMKFTDPVAHALQLVNKYQREMQDSTSHGGSHDREQPAHETQHLWPIAKELSPLMNDYMRKRLDRCARNPSANPRNPEGSATVRSSRENEL